jgi:hypothetical protein
VLLWQKQYPSSLVRYLALLGQKFFPQDAAHNLAFCSYLHLQYFPQDAAHNWAAVPGRRFSNSPTSQSPIVGGNRKCETLNIKPKSQSLI